MAEVEIVEAIKLKEKPHTVVMGFAGAGFIGNTSLMYAARSRGYRKVAHVKSHLIPPMMLLVQGEPTRPFRIYTDKEGKLLFVITETIIPAVNSWPICIELMRWLKDIGVEEFISIEGLPFAAPGRQAFGYTTGKRDISQYGIQETGEGAVSGLNACMMEEAIEKGIDWSTIFVPTRIVNNIDYEGAATALDILNKMFNLGVDISPLQQRAETLKKSTERKKPGILDRLF